MYLGVYWLSLSLSLSLLLADSYTCLCNCSDREGDDDNSSQWVFDTIKEAPGITRPPLPTENGPTLSLITGDERTNDSARARLSNGVEHNDEGSPPPQAKRVSPHNSEFSSQGHEPSSSAPPPPRPNGIPKCGSDGLNPPSVPMETSSEELRDRAFSVTEETRVLDEALSRTSTASLEGANELGTLQPQAVAGRDSTMEGEVDRSKFEKLESSITSEDMETGVGGEMGVASTSYDASLQGEDRPVC